MTLLEIGLEYERSAQLLRARLSELRKELKHAADSEVKWHLKRRIYELTPMLTECNRAAKRCREYYNSLECLDSAQSGENTKNIVSDHGKRIDSAAISSCTKSSDGRPDITKRSRRTRRMLQYNLPHIS